MTSPAISVEAHRNDPPAYRKEIFYDKESRDYGMRLDGELVGYARTYPEAEITLDNLVFELQSGQYFSRDPLTLTATELDGGSDPDQIADEYAADLETRATTADMAADAAAFRAEPASRAGPEWSCTPENPCDGECVDHLSLMTAIHLDGQTTTRIHTSVAKRDEYLRYNPSAWIVVEHTEPICPTCLRPIGRRIYDPVTGVCLDCQPAVEGRQNREGAVAPTWTDDKIATGLAPDASDDDRSLALALSNLRARAQNECPCGSSCPCCDPSHPDAIEQRMEREEAERDDPDLKIAAGAIRSCFTCGRSFISQGPRDILCSLCRVPTPPTRNDCEGYNGNDCLNRAVATREINLSTNPESPYDAQTMRLCGLCSTAWDAWLAAKPCLACGKPHSTQRCSGVLSLLLDDADVVEVRADDLHLTKGFCRSQGYVPEPVPDWLSNDTARPAPDDPCADVREERDLYRRHLVLLLDALDSQYDPPNPDLFPPHTTEYVLDNERLAARAALGE